MIKGVEEVHAVLEGKVEGKEGVGFMVGERFEAGVNGLGFEGGGGGGGGGLHRIVCK